METNTTANETTDTDIWRTEEAVARAPSYSVGPSGCFEQSSACAVTNDELTAVSEGASHREAPLPKTPVRVPSESSTDSLLEKGMSNMNMNENESKKSVGELSNQEPIAAEMKDPHHRPLPSMNSDTNAEPLESRTFTLPRDSLIIEQETNEAQELHGKVSPRTPKAQSQVEDTTWPTSGPAPKLRTPVAVSPMPSVTRIQQQASTNLRRRSKTEAPRPRSSFMSEVAPEELHEVELNPEFLKEAEEAKKLATLIRNEYEDVSRDVSDYQMAHCHEGDKANLPSYQYPGTYEAAKHDSYEAAKNIGSAAKKFGSALVSSGIGKAAWSVGALSLDAGRRAGKHMTTQAIINSGYKDSLPTSVQSWADANEEKRRRKAEAKKREYQTAGQSGSSYKLVNPLAFIKTSEKKDTKTQEINDFKDDSSTGVNEEEERAQKPNPPGRGVQDGWTLINSPVHGAAPTSSRTDGSPYLSTIYESTAGFVEDSATATAKTGGQSTSTTGRLHRS